MQQIFDGIALRFPLAAFYAKGTEKTETFQNFFERDVFNLEIFYVRKLKTRQCSAKDQSVIFKV